MISAARLKEIASLHQKKHRSRLQQILVEGEHLLLEAETAGLNPLLLIVSESWAKRHDSGAKRPFSSTAPEIITDKQFDRLAETETPQGIAAVFNMPYTRPLRFTDNTVILLDNLQDPGNLGTILRTACWLGFSSILLTDASVDVYNAKVMRSSMGAVFHAHVQTDTADQRKLLQLLEDGYLLVGADMAGENLFQWGRNANEKLIIAFGNEGAGLSQTISNLLHHTITIPKFGTGESLNVASSAAIILAQLRNNTK